ncbi:aldehyde ferredoxin oxidoreductase family protein [Candidatus Omnitrophota bacterium]
MTSWHGWAGTILDVDLTTRKVNKEPLSREFATKYIGGSGFGARILYDEVPPGDNALEPENVIIIGQGPLSGTLAPSGGRYELVSKSPLTGIYARSNGGGFFGPEMKSAGYDLIIIRGKSETPVYLWIDDEHVEIRDATPLWGKDTWTTQRMIREELGNHDMTIPHFRHLGDADIQVLKIGPAGENLCYSSCVIGNLGRAAGRCSMGAVWGSKKLKAVAVHGRKGVSVARSAEFKELCVALHERAKRDPLYQLQTKYGTPGWVASPVIAAKYHGASMDSLYHTHFDPLFDKNLACFGCSLGCSHYYRVKEGKYKGTAGEGIEANAVTTALELRIGNPAFVCKYNNLCNQLGLHIDTPGYALAWAMELYQDGIITREDSDGLELTWGNEDVVLDFVRKIACKEGFGEILDAYPIRAAQKLGRESDLYISHAKGLGGFGKLAGVMGRSTQWALALSVATRGRDHLTGAQPLTVPGLRQEISDELLEKLGQERYNNPGAFLKPFSTDPEKAQYVYDIENIYTLCDMTGVCKFASEFGSYIEGTHIENYAQLMSTATGADFSVSELVKAAEREMLLERAFNAREGIRRIDDHPYPFYYQLKYGEKHPRCDYSKFKISLEDYGKVLDDYYKLRGCDLETGIPNKERLEAVGLKDVADDLANRGILPQ